jgi:hypothetical protein
MATKQDLKRNLNIALKAFREAADKLNAMGGNSWEQAERRFASPEYAAFSKASDALYKADGVML